VSLWCPPPISAQARAALARLEAPSRPGPLPGSRRAGASAWQIGLERDDVIAAYQRPGAPVPEGATTAVERGVLVIRAPYSTTCVLFARAPAGVVYSLVPGPTLEIMGGTAAPAGAWYAAVAVDNQNLNTGEPQLSLLVPLEDGDADWLLWVSEDEGGPAGRGKAILEQVDLARLRDAQSNGLEDKAVPARIEQRDGRVHAVFKRGRQAYEVTATRTHSFCALLQTIQAPAPPDPARRVRCVTKRAGAPLHERIAAVGGVTGGKPWRLDAATLVARLAAGDEFHLQADDDADPVPVELAEGPGGVQHPVVKEPGGRRNLLLGLPKCRAVGSPVTPP
jgi:hypothetical protein